MSNNLIWGEGGRSLTTLDKKYLKGVLSNLPLTATVAFGQTGIGHTPNYQVTLETCEKIAYRGQNHERYGQAEEFDDKNISPPFSQPQVLSAFVAVRDRSKHPCSPVMPEKP